MNHSTLKKYINSDDPYTPIYLFAITKQRQHKGLYVWRDASGEIRLGVWSRRENDDTHEVIPYHNRLLYVEAKRIARNNKRASRLKGEPGVREHKELFVGKQFHSPCYRCPRWARDLQALSTPKFERECAAMIKKETAE